MNTEVRERVCEWLTSPDTCFLFGAGCSKCAGKPLIAQLTENVLAKLDKSVKTEFDGLKASNGRKSTIEDLINYLVRYQAILATVSDPTAHKLQPDWIDQTLTAIKRQLVEEIFDDWKASTVHQRLLDRIAVHKRQVDIFTLNYDTVIEATLDEMRANYVDGFRGTNRAWFDPSVFDQEVNSEPIVRLHKLHGSIDLPP